MNQSTSGAGESGVRAYLTTIVIAVLAWLVLLGTDPASWVVGVPCVLICVWFVHTVGPAQDMRVSLSGWLRLIPYFLWCSVVGGWDVARRVLTPSLAVAPGFITYTLSLPAGPARTFFVQFIGLLPGTLGAWLEGDRLTVHVLNLNADHQEALRNAEERVAGAFALRPGL